MSTVTPYLGKSFLIIYETEIKCYPPFTHSAKYMGTQFIYVLLHAIML